MTSARASGGAPPQIGAGLGDQAFFRALMLGLIPRIEVARGDGGSGRPLAGLTTTSPADPTLALLDCVAAMADIVSFYQDRILNEGYLPNAVDPSSLALFARGLGIAPAMFLAAAVDLALFAAPGRDVTVPAGAAVQASLPRSADAAPSAAPLAAVFETSRTLVARPALNRLAALLTGPARLVPDASDLLLAGTGLGFKPGDTLLLVREPVPSAADLDPSQTLPQAWMRLTILAAQEDAALRATAVAIDGTLQGRWAALGCTDLPLEPKDGLALYALDRTCRLFGYDAGSWTRQPYAVQRTAVPPGQPVGAYAQWPGFSVDPGSLDLQAVYPNLVPGSRMLVEMPGTQRLSTVLSASRERVAKYGLSGEVTHVTLGPPGGIRPEPAGGDAVAAAPAEPAVIAVPGPVFAGGLLQAALTSTWLADGTVLIVAVTAPPQAAPPFLPLHPFGPLTARAWIFDPATTLSTETGSPGTARIGASLTLLTNGTVLLAGGQTYAQPFGPGTTLDSAEIYDPRSRTFVPIERRSLCTPRWGHTATALPDGTVLLAGGFNGTDAQSSAELFDPARQAFVVVATTLPAGAALHGATLLSDGTVLIAGGVASIPSELLDGLVPAPATGPVLDRAAIYDPAVKAFGEIAPMASPRACHSATLLADGRVLLAGGTATPDQAPLSTTEIFDPHARRFASGPPLAAPRIRHGAAALGDGALLVGGTGAPTYAVIQADPGAPLPAAPLPFDPSARIAPGPASLLRQIDPMPIGPAGIVAFAGTGDGLMGARFPREPAPPAEDARREALVFAQSRPLALARPLDTRPIGGDGITLDGRVDGLEPGRCVLVAGQPPLARTVGAARIVGGPTLPEGTLVAVTAPLTGAPPGLQWWQAAMSDAARLTIETLAGTGLRFLAGTGEPPGTVTPADAKRIARPVLCERAQIRSVAFDAEAGATAVRLAGALARLYDRTTLTVYGNAVAATEGRSVAGEVLGNGNGEIPFQSFILRLAPLAALPDPDGGFAPQITVQVDGLPWRRVAALDASGPHDRAYQLDLDVQGRARVQFGDGLHGQRLPSGRDNVTADYRVGAGAAGNLPAGSLTRPPARVAGIRSVLNPMAAEGGADAGTRAGLRAAIPEAVRRTGRIVTPADILTFVLADPAVGAATLSMPGSAILVTLAGPGNAVPDLEAPAFQALRHALDRAMAARLPVVLLPCRQVPFKLAATATADADPARVRSALTAALRAQYDAPAMRFARPVVAADLARLLGGVSGVGGPVTITRLWSPGPADAADPAFLRPAAAAGDPAAGLPYRGAEILALSPDSDAVAVTLRDPRP